MTATARHAVWDLERHAIGVIFRNWHGAPGQSNTARHLHVLDRTLGYLEPLPGPAGAMRRLLNAQISVDTANPDRLRLTMDPLAGAAFPIVPRERAIRAVRDLDCGPLETSVERLYASGCELPQNLWIGLAPADEGYVVKAYISSRTLDGAAAVSRAARAAGWLPPTVSPNFRSTYERLVPFFAAVEGVGLSFNGDVRLGTTVYFRAVRPWATCISDDACAFLGMSPAHAVRRLTNVLGGPPAGFGWSAECDLDGCLVDVKLEVKVDGWYSANALTDYASERGIDPAPIGALAGAIARGGLCEPSGPSPAFLSLRLVGGEVRSIVVYLPLTAVA
jgi:hypothetical protein